MVSAKLSHSFWVYMPHSAIHGETSSMNLSMYPGPRGTFTARLSLVSNQIIVHKSAMQVWQETIPITSMVCLVAVLRGGRFKAWQLRISDPCPPWCRYELEVDQIQMQTLVDKALWWEQSMAMLLNAYLHMVCGAHVYEDHLIIIFRVEYRWKTSYQDKGSG